MKPRRWPQAVKPPLHLLRLLAFAAVRPWLARRAVKHQGASGRGRVFFVLEHAYGMGGTIRSVLNLASHLAGSFDVEVISLVRRRAEPFFALPPGVRVRVLYDQTQQARRPVLARLPSLLVHEEDGAYSACSALTDLRLLRTFAALPPGILITTRPAFSLIAARLKPPQLVPLAQEHVSHRNHRPGVARAVAHGYPRLPALVVLTEDDERFYARLCEGSGTAVVRIPNALPPIEPVTGHRSEVVVSAGRLLGQKRFDVLIDAFGTAAAMHPGWELDICGSGVERDNLRERIHRQRLGERVRLSGRTQQIGAVFSRASVFALTARNEGFGLVVIEAMRCGLPVVCFDSGGPAEIVTHGHDGLLVPDGDTEAFGAALAELMADEPRRARMGAAAAATSKKYDISNIGPLWDELLGSLAAGRTDGG